MVVESGAARYGGGMGKVIACDVPKGSLLATFGAPEDYRDCFAREVSQAVSLAQYIERFYCSMAFRPERILLGLIGRGASNADARALARGETDHFGVWEVIERRSATSGPQGRPPARSDATTGRVSEDSLRGRMAPPALEAKTNGLDEILLHSKGTGTASWLAVAPLSSSSKAVGQTGASSSSAAIGQTNNPDTTTLYFGSWVGNLEQSGWRFMARPHQWYSRVLLGGV